MRLIKVEFSGFKRLKSTKCNLDGKLIAILGPNEAGKSSVLNGLAWLTDGGRLENFKRTRNNDISDDHEVVRAQFALSDEDLNAIDTIETDVRPQRLIVSRTAGDTLRYDTEPVLRRRSEPFEKARNGIKILLKQIAAADPFNNLKDVGELRAELAELDAALQAHDQMSNLNNRLIESVNSAVRTFLNIDQSLYSDDVEKALVKSYAQEAATKLATALADVSEILARPHPNLVIAERLWKRSPDFVLFTENDRTLLATYELGDSATRFNPPKALVNVLAVAGTSVPAIYDAVVSNDKTRLRTLIRRANAQLAESMRHAWRQADLTVSINTDSTALEILIEEHGADDIVTTIEERSDGLRTFIALVCFLQTRPTAYPPILLIDEAETHLHLDAQADLIEVLSKQEAAQQIIYTTHSPGCLPADLGTGVRFVEPDPHERGLSRLRNDFWQTSTPGFGPMLFAMGAGAAAFSVCRHAVLCEGPSEMILLPTLLRLANGLSVLPYQIAPGLSVARQEDLAANTIAADVLYLTDGDDGGKALSKQLLTAGVQRDRIFTLPEGGAVEDLIDPTFYLDTVSGVVAESGLQFDRPQVRDLIGGKSISKNLEIWGKQSGLKLPGKIAIASHLAPGLAREQITTEGSRVLQELHSKWMEFFENRRRPTARQDNRKQIV